MNTLTLAPAKNQRADVLRMLIESEDGLSERDTVFNGFRSRITELKRIPGLNIHTVREPFITQFGKKSNFNVHFLLEIEKDAAIAIYEKINK